MGRITIVLLFAVYFFGCGVRKTPCQRAQKICPSHDSIAIKDSIRIKDSISVKTVLNIKDSVVIKDSLVVQQSLPCVDGAKTRIVRGGDVFDVSVKNGMIDLKVNLQGSVSRFSSKIKEQETTIKNLTYKLSTKEKVKTLPPIVRVITHTPWWMKALAFIGGVSIFLFLGKMAINKLADGI
jgi:hypothetical protein